VTVLRPTIGRSDLEPIVPRVVGRDVEAGEWQCEPLSYVELNPVSGGVYRVTGAGWSLILKVLRHPAGRALPTGEPVPPGWGTDPRHYNYWLREAEILGSDELDDLAGISAPRVFGIVERSSTSRWLWLEDVPGVDVEWSDNRYRAVARRLGQFNGSYVAGRPIPAESSDAFLPTWVADSADAITALANGENLDHPTLARLCPPDVVARVIRLWDERHALFATLARLPQCFAHLDAFGSNLLFCNGEVDARPTVVDWAFAGRAAVGEEIVQLGMLTPIMTMTSIEDGRRVADAVFDGYLAGLEEAGAACDPDDVALAYSAGAALRWGLVAYRSIAGAIEHEDVAATFEEFYGRPLDEVVDYTAATQEWLLDEADRAYRLASRHQ